MKQKIFLISISLIGIAISCLIIEIILRKYNLTPPIFRISTYQVKFSEDPLLGYDLIPNYDDTNVDGFRSPLVPLIKDPKVTRIAMLGDSIAFGCCKVPMNEIMSEQLVNKLNNNPERKTTYDIINAGVPGYNTIQEAELFKTKVKNYKPDIVLLQLTIANDYLPMTYKYEELILSLNDKNLRTAAYKFYELASRSNKTLYSLYSYRYLLYTATVIQSELKSLTKTEDSLLYNIPLSAKDDWTTAIKPLVDEKEKNSPWSQSTIIPDGFKLLKESVDYPTRVIVFIVPDFKYKLPGYNQETINQHLDVVKWANDNNFESLDLLSCYQEFSKANPNVEIEIGDRIHPNTLGHKIASQCIYDYITNPKKL